jgi:transposase
MSLPLDPALLDRLPPEVRALVEAQAKALEEERAQRAVVEHERAELKDLVARLKALVQALREARFAAKSEKLHPDQLQMAFEDIEETIAEVQEQQDRATERQAGQRPPRQDTVRRAVPKGLPRIEERVVPEDLTCPCGCGAMVAIGEDRSDRLDIVPAQLRVLVTVRPRFACPKGRAGVVQAPPPPRLIEGGLPTEAFLAWLVVSKYADALPLYRIAQILARSGVEIDRSTLADWVGRTAFHLEPVVQHMLGHLRRSTKLFMDETSAPVLDPGRGRTKTGFLWALTRDDRRWSGPGPAITVFSYAPGRGGAHAEAMLTGFEGILQVDGYTGYNRLTLATRTGGAPVTLAYCWAHARREFIEATPKAGSPLADEALRRIAQLYAIEAEIRGRPAEERRAVRQARSAPLAASLHAWAQDKATRLSAKSDLGRAVRYLLNHWDGLTVFLQDGRVEMDSNPVENSIRPLALQRKNSLFAGHDEGGRNWARLASLIATCRLNGVEPFAWLKATLTAIAHGHPQARIEELMPWNFTPATGSAPDPKIAEKIANEAAA